MNVTFFGTTTLLFDDGKDALLFDGHFTRPSLMTYLLGNLRTDTAMADHLLDRFDFSRLRGIFVSHTHHDHVMDVPYIAGKTGAVVYGSESAANVCRGGGVPEEKITVFHPEMPVTVGDFTVTILPSVHSDPTIFNNDLGQTIDEPVVQPARKKSFKEGGSFDFLIRHGDQTILIRPSFNYLAGQLDDVRADLLPGDHRQGAAEEGHPHPLGQLLFPAGQTHPGHAPGGGQHPPGHGPCGTVLQ